jgi:hypothetical protein
LIGFLQSKNNKKTPEPTLYEVQPGTKEKVNIIPALKEFLKPEGPPIVYIALSDLPYSQHDSIIKLLEITIETVNHLEVRCVIGGESGWKAILKHQIKQYLAKQSTEDLAFRKRKLEDDFFILELNPDFDDITESVCKWTLPQCQCVVHHGSSSMTALSLTVGIPTVIISTFPDQVIIELNFSNSHRHIGGHEFMNSLLVHNLFHLHTSQLLNFKMRLSFACREK